MQERDPETIRSSIRSQLRSITRLIWDLRKPIGWVEALEEKEPPNLVIPLEPGAVWQGAGLKLGGLNSLSVPNERVIDDGYELVGHVYSLKDRFHLLAKTIGHSATSKGHTQNTNEIVASSFDLKVCGDLTNLKKHGRHHNNSKKNPALGNVIYDTSVCGPVEIQYDGGSKATALLVSNGNSIYYRIEVLNDDQPWADNVLNFVTNALDKWRPLILELGVATENDRESEFIRHVYSFE